MVICDSLLGFAMPLSRQIKRQNNEMDSFTTEARVFPCTKCREMIYSDALNCPSCSAPIDRQAAEAAADNQEKVNNAVNLATWIRNSAWVMCGFVVFGTIFRVAFLAVIAFFFLIPLSLISWQIKYGGLKTADADFGKTKRDRVTALLLWLGASVMHIWLVAVRFLLLG